jgi:hypothetical protein
VIAKPTPEHEVAYQDLVALVGKHKDSVDAVEMLAIAANMIGKLAGLQDHRALSPEQVLDIIIKNIEIGNQQLMDELNDTKGSA